MLLAGRMYVQRPIRLEGGVQCRANQTISGCYPFVCTVAYNWAGWCLWNHSDWPCTADIHSLVPTAAYRPIGEVGGPM